MLDFQKGNTLEPRLKIIRGRLPHEGTKEFREMMNYESEQARRYAQSYGGSMSNLENWFKIINDFEPSSIPMLEEILSNPNLKRYVHGRVLDVGSGTCWLTAKVSRLEDVEEVQALDLSEKFLLSTGVEVLRHFEANFDKITLVVGDFNRIPIEDKFDCIFLFGSLHHSLRPVVTLKEVSRCAKESATIMIYEHPVGWIHRNQARVRAEELSIGSKEKRMQEFDWETQTVFITGAAGFVGSWLAQELVSKGSNVIVLAREIIPRSNFMLLELDKRTTFVRGSVTNLSLIERILNEYDVQTVFHLAAQAIVRIANRSPLSTFESNIKGTWTLLEACRLSKTVERVVVASSDKAYGVHKTLPYKEDFPLNPLYPYDVSKACADMIARCYFHTYGLPVAVTRFANIYGGGDLNFSRIIPDTIRSVLRDENPVIRSDGTPERDFLYIDDAVDLYLRLAENLHREEIQGEAFNAGSGQPISILDLVKKIIEVSGKTHLQPDIQGEGLRN